MAAATPQMGHEMPRTKPNAPASSRGVFAFPRNDPGRTLSWDNTGAGI